MQLRIHPWEVYAVRKVSHHLQIVEYHRRSERNQNPEVVKQCLSGCEKTADSGGSSDQVITYIQDTTQRPDSRPQNRGMFCFSAAHR